MISLQKKGVGVASTKTLTFENRLGPKSPFRLTSVTAASRSDFRTPAESQESNKRSWLLKSANYELWKSGTAKYFRIRTYTKIGVGVPAANVFFAANVIPWNELRGVNKVWRAFSAATLLLLLHGEHNHRTQFMRRRRLLPGVFGLFVERIGGEFDQLHANVIGVVDI
jgi:hypothetical protein